MTMQTSPALDKPTYPVCFCTNLIGDDSFKSKQILPKPSNDGQWQQTAQQKFVQPTPLAA
jgi:hypothetical protein